METFANHGYVLLLAARKPFLFCVCEYASVSGTGCQMKKNYPNWSTRNQTTSNKPRLSRLAGSWAMLQAYSRVDIAWSLQRLWFPYSEEFLFQWFIGKSGTPHWKSSVLFFPCPETRLLSQPCIAMAEVQNPFSRRLMWVLTPEILEYLSVFPSQAGQ